MSRTMKAFWKDLNDVVESGNPRKLTLKNALNTWADSRRVQGNYFGLIDDQDHTIQFYFEDDIPDEIEDARHLRIVSVDFPIPERRGSFSKLVTIGESSELIEKAFRVGANPEEFDGLEFSSWHG